MAKAHKNPHKWKKGQSGNPKGRPPVGDSVAELARDVLQAKTQGNRTRALAILEKMGKIAETEGSVTHASFLFDRGYGKVKEVVETLGPPANDAAADFVAFIRMRPELQAAYLEFLKKRDNG